MGVSRRNLLIGTGAAGALLVGWSLLPRRYATPLTADAGEFAVDAWLKVGSDGVVTVAVPDLEMGQGITTLLPQIVATELGADWRQVAVEPAPVSGAYANVPLAAHWRALWMPALADAAEGPDNAVARGFAQRNAFVATAAGTALIAHEAPARAAAASARAMLAKAAAERWDVGWEECDAKDGFIVNGNRKLSFAELATRAADFDPPDPPVLRPQPAAERGIDQPEGSRPAFPRLDLPGKVDGSAQFAGDIRLPGMVFAAIRQAPQGDGRIGDGWAERKARSAGVQLVAGDDWIAATASSWWLAERELSALVPTFTAQHKADTVAAFRLLDEALHHGEGRTVHEAGDAEATRHKKFDLARSYRIAPALTAPLETAAATARVGKGRVELWVASQAPEATRQAVAAATGVAASAVVLYPVPAGGSFDARLDTRHAVQAALIAQAVGKPVQLTWSRWQEAVGGFPRSPARAVLAAKTTPDGSLRALKIRVAMPATTAEFGKRLFGGGTAFAGRAAQEIPDPLALAGCVPPYAIPDLLVEHVPVAVPLSTGPQRGGAAALGCFLVETFIDELAGLARREPLSYRIAMLGSDTRLAACLQRAATLANWQGGVGGTGQGIACHRMAIAGREGRIALVASARRGDRGIEVDRLTAVVDIGRVVNLDIARQQIEGGLLFGLGLARGATTTWADGLPASGRLGTLALPRLADSPDIEIEFIDGTAPPFDPGELGVAVAAPAIANALFSAGTTRLRALPLTAGDA